MTTAIVEAVSDKYGYSIKYKQDGRDIWINTKDEKLIEVMKKLNLGYGDEINFEAEGRILKGALLIKKGTTPKPRPRLEASFTGMNPDIAIRTKALEIASKWAQNPEQAVALAMICEKYIRGG